MRHRGLHALGFFHIDDKNKDLYMNYFITDDLKEFVSARSRWLNPPASEQDLALLRKEFPDSPDELFLLYSMCDGDKFDPFDQRDDDDEEGSLFYPFSIWKLQPLIDYSKVYKRRNFDGIASYPKCIENYFVPFIRTDLKTTIGVFTQQSPFMPGYIAEIFAQDINRCETYDSVDLILWADSLSTFLHAYITYGLKTEFKFFESDFDPDADQTHTLDCIEYLRQFSGIYFPCVKKVGVSCFDTSKLMEDGL